MPARKQRELPKPGSVYRKVYRGDTFALRVLRTPEGIKYSLNGKVFRSPSAAAKAITLSEVNGWTFWGIDNEG